jgi:hypothetical protein
MYEGASCFFDWYVACAGHCECSDSEEVLLSLSSTIVEKDAPPHGLRSSIAIKAGGGERITVPNPYDMGMSPPRVGGYNVSLDPESVDAKKSRGPTPSANKAEDAKLPQAKRPFTRFQTKRGATGE